MTITEVALYHAKQIRLCEQRALDELGLGDEELMALAGQNAFLRLIELYPTVRKIMVFCGSGNNAGDGYVLARLAQEQGYTVFINQYKSIEKLPFPAQQAAIAAVAAGVVYECTEDFPEDIELIVDALLGIGLRGDVYGPIARAICQINESKLPVLSLDVPSGLNADTGNVMGVCVRASATISFIATKLGMLTADGPDYCGNIYYYSLGLTKCLETIKPAAYRLRRWSLSPLVKRPKNTHKGNYGHVLVVGSGLGMPGASYLSAQAALRVGAGLVTIATRPEHAGKMLPLLPEAMIYGVTNPQQLALLIGRASICIIGPGLGEDEWANLLFKEVIVSQIPMIIDASALRILAQDPQHDDNWVLTPHPGEAATLLHCTTADIQEDRYQSVIALQHKYGGTVILKGVGSLVCTNTADVYLCDAGNPGMASPGMGDALSGVIAGLCAQGLLLSEAAKLAVWLHAKAADCAALELGERGLLASDLMPYLHRFVNRLPADH